MLTPNRRVKRLGQIPKGLGLLHALTTDPGGGSKVHFFKIQTGRAKPQATRRVKSNPDVVIYSGTYPVSVQTSPRERLIVDYEIRPGSSRITGYFMTFPEDW